jgi:hypothetical protein
MRTATLAVAVAALLIVASGAKADVAFQTAVLSPVATGGQGLGVQPLASQLNGQYLCLDPATIANTHDSWAIGNCTGQGFGDPNQLFYGTTQVTSGGYPWYGGYFSANFNHCGWIGGPAGLSLYPMNNLANSNCQGASAFSVPTDFIAPGSCGTTHNLMIWSNAGCSLDGSDGLPAYNGVNCPAFANDAPWYPNETPTDYEYTIPADPPNSNHTNPVELNVRYQTKYLYNGPPAIPMYMVRVLNPPFGSNWVFIPASCALTLK